MESFSQGLFNDKEVVKIRDAAIATKFIQGMVLGTLNPKQYGGFMVQDAAYCFAAVEAVDNAAKEMQHQGMLEFSSLYQEQSKLLKEYNEDFVKTWHLKNAESIVMGRAADKYVKYEDDVSRQRPKFLAIAMLPCIMLWPWIANQLISHVKENNPYYFWFEENKIEEGDLKTFVDSHFSPEEKEEALDIFRDGMINELNFFRDACNESLVHCPSDLPPCEPNLPSCLLL